MNQNNQTVKILDALTLLAGYLRKTFSKAKLAALVKAWRDQEFVFTQERDELKIQLRFIGANDRTIAGLFFILKEADPPTLKRMVKDDLSVEASALILKKLKLFEQCEKTAASVKMTSATREKVNRTFQEVLDHQIALTWAMQGKNPSFAFSRYVMPEMTRSPKQQVVALQLVRIMRLTDWDADLKFDGSAFNTDQSKTRHPSHSLQSKLGVHHA